MVFELQAPDEALSFHAGIAEDRLTGPYFLPAFLIVPVDYNFPRKSFLGCWKMWIC
jgi:hypothetical protein